MNDINTINRIYKWADKKRQKYKNDYQLTGSQSSMTTYERYEDICDICAVAEREKSKEDTLKQHTLQNQMHIIARLHDVRRVSPNKTFTYEEVEEWMRKMM